MIATDLLDDLELKIDSLVKALQMIKLENNSLRKKVARLSKENVELFNKKKSTAVTLKNLIIQLKDELYQAKTDGYIERE